MALLLEKVLVGRLFFPAQYLYSQNAMLLDFVGVTSEQMIHLTLREGTGKVTPCLRTRNQAPRHSGVWGREGIAQPFLTLALYGGVWSALRHCCFTFEEITHVSIVFEAR